MKKVQKGVHIIKDEPKVQSYDVCISEGLFEYFVNEKLIFSKHHLRGDIQQFFKGLSYIYQN